MKRMKMIMMTMKILFPGNVIKISAYLQNQYIFEYYFKTLVSLLRCEVFRYQRTYIFIYICIVVSLHV